MKTKASIVIGMCLFGMSISAHAHEGLGGCMNLMITKSAVDAVKTTRGAAPRVPKKEIQDDSAYLNGPITVDDLNAGVNFNEKPDVAAENVFKSFTSADPKVDANGDAKRRAKILYVVSKLEQQNTEAFKKDAEKSFTTPLSRFFLRLRMLVKSNNPGEVTKKMWLGLSDDARQNIRNVNAWGFDAKKEILAERKEMSKTMFFLRESNCFEDSYSRIMLKMLEMDESVKKFDMNTEKFSRLIGERDADTIMLYRPLKVGAYIERHTKIDEKLFDDIKKAGITGAANAGDGASGSVGRNQ